MAAQGDKGDKADKGTKGDKGNTGNKGDKGNKGDRGLRGPTGPVGETVTLAPRLEKTAKTGEVLAVWMRRARPHAPTSELSDALRPP